MKILLMKGLPCSGKTTHARALVESSSTWRRINRDDLRMMIDNGAWSQSKEKTIRKAELALAELFLNQQYNVIVDDTNLSPSALSMWQEFAKQKNVLLEIKDFTHVPLEECIARNKRRASMVDEQDIRRMYRDFLAPKPPPVTYDLNLPDAIICDLDGTIALMGDRNPYDASICEQDQVNTAIQDILEKYSDSCYRILLVSGRQEAHRPETERWLSTHHIPYNCLWMRPTGDMRKDALIKQEIYEREIKGKYNVMFILDDRNQVVALWRSLGLTCLQVADGDF